MQTERENDVDKFEKQIQLLNETLTKTLENCMERIEARITKEKNEARGTQSVEGKPPVSTQDSKGYRNRVWQNGDRPPPRCWGCGKIGHLKRSCPDLPKEEMRAIQDQRNERGPDLRVEDRQ